MSFVHHGAHTTEDVKRDNNQYAVLLWIKLCCDILNISWSISCRQFWQLFDFKLEFVQFPSFIIFLF